MNLIRRAAFAATSVVLVVASVFAVSSAAVADPTPVGSVRFRVVPGTIDAPMQANEISIALQYSSDGATWSDPQTQVPANSRYPTLSGLSYGHYRATVTDLLRTGLAPQNITFDVAAPSAVLPAPVVLAGTSTVAGTVRLDDPTSGNPRPATAGEVQAVLYVLSNGTFYPYTSTTALTDSSGGFSFDGIDTTDFSFTLDFVYKGTDPGYIGTWLGGSSWDSPGGAIGGSSAAIPPVAVTLSYTNTIGGTLTDSASRPLAGVAVCAIPQAIWQPSMCSQTAWIGATSDSAGHYAIGKLADGPYVIEFRPPNGYSGQVWHGANAYGPPTPVVLGGQKLVSGFDATIYQDNTIATTVSIKGLSASQLAAVGNSFVDVQQLDQGSNTWVDSNRWLQSDATGHLTITSLLPGTYRVDLKFTDKFKASVHKLSDPVTFNGEGQAASVSATLVQAIRPGTTVMMPGSPAVYLVDGSTTLVPVDSMTTLTDLGFSTNPVVYDKSRLSTYTISSAHLSDVVGCYGNAYLGAEGVLHDFTPATGLSKTPHGITHLDDATCDVLKRADYGSITPPILGVHGNPTVYSIGDDGKKHPYISMDDLRAQASYFPDINWVSSYFLDQFPVGGIFIPPGRLVKATSSPTVYLVDGWSRLAPLTSFDPVIDAGVPLQIDVVAASQLSDYTASTTPFRNTFDCYGTRMIAGAGKIYILDSGVATGLPSTTIDPETCNALTLNHFVGTLHHALFVKSATDPTIYFVNAAGAKQRVFSMSTLATLSAPDPAAYVTVNNGFLASIPNGPDLVMPGMLVKSPTSPTVYVADGSGGIIPIRSFTTASDLGVPGGLVTASAATISSLTVAPTTLSNLVSCSGTDWIGAQGELWPIDPSVVGSLPVSTLPSTLCAVLPKSSATLGTNVFIKTAASAVVFALQAGVKHPVGSWATLVRLAGAQPVTVLTADSDFVGRVPTGASLP
ncbi:carboxypeptidase-like regulatory domain-containing protein [Leifsonia shinshuensis]|uniref:carboxypeptidase-like regulatory domain-containing protein n=1 Tax=Leifsonia shinshuensis TaxID=150026 RepID=UPI001F50E100|nr:carboxypeptidase-like regulatory domain-containing protein [Leifsonia shinshuensis]